MLEVVYLSNTRLHRPSSPFEAREPSLRNDLYLTYRLTIPKILNVLERHEEPHDRLTL